MGYIINIKIIIRYLDFKLLLIKASYYINIKLICKSLFNI